MTSRHDTDRLIATWLIETNPEGPVDYLDETLSAIGGIRQRPAWAALGRWLPVRLTLPRVAVPRSALYLALLALLLIGVVLALAIAGSQRRLPPPFGIARTGLVTFVSGDDIYEAKLDGASPRPLITGDGLQWGLTWSHRGDRFAYWSAPSIDTPASLWVADSDGSNRYRISASPVPGVGDLLSNVSWSPDDRQIAFSGGGGLSLVNADGSGLHPIGDGDHARSDPVWSPDGSLIAYTGQPFGDRDFRTSIWVITPDGVTDTSVIEPEGKDEIGTNDNPSWSPDSRALLVHSGGATGSLGDPIPTSISIARRDDAGKWTTSQLISGSAWNYLPSWSTDGTRFTFLRGVEGTTDGEYVVMIADADGLNIHQPSVLHVALATPCWTPDDRYIRASGLASGGNHSIVLLPLDNSAPVLIPVLGNGPSTGCQAQRLAP